MHWGSSTFLGFNPLYLFVRTSKVVPWLLLAIANERLDLVWPMRGLHEKSHANRVGYLSHSSIVAHYPNNSIVLLEILSRRLGALVDRIQ